MASALFYFGANIAALTAVVLTGAGCLICNPRSFNARIFACVTVSLACYLVGRISYAVPADVQVSFRIWPYLLTFMNTGVGFWMILAYSLFQDDRRIPRWMIVACAVQFLLSAINAFGYVGRDSSVLQSETYPPIVHFIFGPLPIAMQTVFAFLALYWAARGWRADLDEGRRVLRGLFLIVVGSLTLGISVTELYLFGEPYSSRAPFDNAITLIMAVGYVTVALGVLRFDSGVLERLVDRVSPLPDPEVDPLVDRQLAALTRALEKERVYLTPGLSIGGLAKRLAIPEYRLRALINKRLGYRNFNALLHKYRLRDACEQLADPARAQLPILTIALEVGYQSIAPFNQAFRDVMGCTPSAYRRRHTKPGLLRRQFSRQSRHVVRNHAHSRGHPVDLHHAHQSRDRARSGVGQRALDVRSGSRQAGVVRQHVDQPWRRRVAGQFGRRLRAARFSHDARCATDRAQRA
jgi:AraC-like DNA-binding protein